MTASAPPPVRLFDQRAVSELLSLDDCIAAVRAAFAAHAEGRAFTPGLLHVDAEGGEFHIKVGGLHGGRSYFAAKVNGGFFRNRIQHGLPNIIGLILLSDGTTGTPLAVFESGVITRLRTGAATAVAAEHLARPDSRTVTLCGAGLQAEVQLRALLRVLPLERCFVWSRNVTGAAAFARSLSAELDLDIQPIGTLGTATRQSDVIVTCTPSKSWYLGREHIVPGTFIAAVGADSPDKQELEPALLVAATVVCDLTDQCAHVGELHHALATRHLERAHVHAELGQVIVQRAPGRTSPEEITIFDSTGTALQDAAAAAAAYERALSTGRGQAFPFWNGS